MGGFFLVNLALSVMYIGFAQQADAYKHGANKSELDPIECFDAPCFLLIHDLVPGDWAEWWCWLWLWCCCCCDQRQVSNLTYAAIINR